MLLTEQIEGLTPWSLPSSLSLQTQCTGCMGYGKVSRTEVRGVARTHPNGPWGGQLCVCIWTGNQDAVTSFLILIPDITRIVSQTKHRIWARIYTIIKALKNSDAPNHAWYSNSINYTYIHKAGLWLLGTTPHRELPGIAALHTSVCTGREVQSSYCAVPTSGCSMQFPLKPATSAPQPYWGNWRTWAQWVWTVTVPGPTWRDRKAWRTPWPLLLHCGPARVWPTTFIVHFSSQLLCISQIMDNNDLPI